MAVSLCLTKVAVRVQVSKVPPTMTVEELQLVLERPGVSVGQAITSTISTALAVCACT